MRKDSARVVNNRSNFSTIQQFTQEALQEMNDDRLEALKSMLRGKIFSLTKNQKNNPDVANELVSLQTEHSYVSRELEIRHNRKKMHEEYLQRTRRGKYSGRRGGRPRRD